MDAEEKEIFVCRPVLISQLGTIVLGILLLPLWGLGLILLFIAWYKTASRQYRLTTERFFCRRGLIAKHIDQVELYRIKDVKLDQGVLGRMFHYGTITILSTDNTTPVFRLEGIANPEPIEEQLRTVYRNARKQEGAHVAELI